MLTNKVTIDFDVFGAFMKNIVMSYLNGILIVIIENSGKTLRNTHFFKKPSKPDEQLRSICKSTIFYFGTGSGDKRLFLATP